MVCSGGRHRVQRRGVGLGSALAFALACLFTISTNAAAPQIIHVPEGQFEAENVTPNLSYYGDPTGTLTLKQVMELPDYAWQSTDASALRFGFTSDVYWLRMRIDQPGSEPALLVATPTLFDKIEAYFVAPGEVLDDRTPNQITGVSFNPELRATGYRKPVLELNFQGKREILLRTETTNAYTMGFNLMDQVSYRAQENKSMMFQGGYFSVLGFSSLLFFIISLALRHKPMFALGLLTLFSSLSEAIIAGFFANELWDPGLTYRNALGLTLGATMIAAYYFFSEALELKTAFPLADWALKIVAAGCLAAMLASGFVGQQFTLASITGLGMIAAITVLVAAGRLAFLGNQFAIFTVVASAAALLGYLQRALVALQITPANVLSQNAIQFGFLFMVLCLTLGLGYEIRNRQREMDAQGKALSLERARSQEAANAELEQEVKNRTQELENALSELADANESLKVLNTVDQVTGIKNRYYFDNSFEQEWKRASREHYPISLIMLDVDHFKSVNDTYGHVVGDECLRQIASRIDGNIKRSSDTLARFGGEEFVVLLPFADNESAMVLAEQVRKSLEDNPIKVDEHEINAKLSAGVCTVIPSEEDTPKDLITSADLALYEAKSTGRNRVCNAGILTVHKNASA